MLYSPHRLQSLKPQTPNTKESASHHKRNASLQFPPCNVKFKEKMNLFVSLQLSLSFITNTILQIVKFKLSYVHLHLCILTYQDVDIPTYRHGNILAYQRVNICPIYTSTYQHINISQINVGIITTSLFQRHHISTCFKYVNLIVSLNVFAYIKT